MLFAVLSNASYIDLYSVGRVDDVIVLATGKLCVPHVECPTDTNAGENIIPLAQESHLVANALIAGAVIFGRGRDFPGVLIEPHAAHSFDSTDASATQAFIDKIWYALITKSLTFRYYIDIPSLRSVVEEANKIAMAYARIAKHTIIITNRHRPLPRAAKGTLIRKQALALYEDDIEKL